MKIGREKISVFARRFVLLNKKMRQQLLVLLGSMMPLFFSHPQVYFIAVEVREIKLILGYNNIACRNTVSFFYVQNSSKA